MFILEKGKSFLAKGTKMQPHEDLRYLKQWKKNWEFAHHI